MNDTSELAQTEVRARQLEPIIARATREMLDAGVIMEGHFRLSPTDHSGHYVNSQALFHQPDLSWRLAQDLIDVLPPDLASEIEGVAGPASGGAIVAHQVAGLLSSRRRAGQAGVLFYGLTKDPNDDVQHVMPAYYSRRIKDRKILLVDDVISTGVTMDICSKLIRTRGATLLGIAAYVDRGFARLPLPMQPTVLWKGQGTSKYHRSNCPMCKAGVPITQF